MNYKDLNLKIKTEKNIAVLPDNTEIQVSKYLPISDKIDLIQIALQKSEENGVYNEVKLDMYFNLYLVEMYSDIEFTPEEKEDEYKLYDELQSNDVINQIIAVMEESEYTDLLEYLQTMKWSNAGYRNSAAALFRTFIQDMPKNAAAAAEIVDNFDKEKYSNVVDFVKSANNGQLS